MKFNVNNTVMVKLTDEGMKILEDQYNEMRKYIPSLREWEPPRVDEDGYTRFQLWSLMSKFGNSISLGSVLPFDCEIIFPDA